MSFYKYLSIHNFKRLKKRNKTYKDLSAGKRFLFRQKNYCHTNNQ